MFGNKIVFKSHPANSTILTGKCCLKVLKLNYFSKKKLKNFKKLIFT